MRKIDRLPENEECDPKLAIGFAAIPVLPGESQEEFETLLGDLCVQYEPEGPIEEDAVLTIGNALWRKRHLRIFQLAFDVNRHPIGTPDRHPKGTPPSYALSD